MCHSDWIVILCPLPQVMPLAVCVSRLSLVLQCWNDPILICLFTSVSCIHSFAHCWNALSAVITRLTSIHKLIHICCPLFILFVIGL